MHFPLAQFYKNQPVINREVLYQLELCAAQFRAITASHLSTCETIITSNKPLPVKFKELELQLIHAHEDAVIRSGIMTMQFPDNIEPYFLYALLMAHDCTEQNNQLHEAILIGKQNKLEAFFAQAAQSADKIPMHIDQFRSIYEFSGCPFLEKDCLRDLLMETINSMIQEIQLPLSRAKILQQAHLVSEEMIIKEAKAHIPTINPTLMWILRKLIFHINPDPKIYTELAPTLNIAFTFFSSTKYSSLKQLEDGINTLCNDLQVYTTAWYKAAIREQDSRLWE
jgi:hypothetical protein